MLASMEATLHIAHMRKSGLHRFIPGSESVAIGIRLCDSSGCDAPGLYRAPRSREILDRFYWFCLDHIRDYNKRWNYFAGMSEDEVEAVIRQDTIWERPTWPLGSRFLRDRRRLSDDALRAAMGEARARRAAHHGPVSEDARWRFNEKERRALRTLDLDLPVTAADIKARYKALAKRHHPDANGGDRAAEERLKTINDAYRTLNRKARS